MLKIFYESKICQDCKKRREGVERQMERHSVGKHDSPCSCEDVTVVAPDQFISWPIDGQEGKWNQQRVRDLAVMICKQCKLPAVSHHVTQQAKNVRLEA